MDRVGGVADPETPNEHLARAREAASNRRWADATGAFSAADTETALDAEDLGSWATAAYLIGDTEAAVAARTRQHRIHLDEGDLSAAVRAAFWVVFTLANSGQTAQAGGWMARVMGLAESLPAGAPERGYLWVLAAFQQVAIEGDFEEGIRLANAAVELGRSTREDDLVALGLNVRARGLMMSGRAAEGLTQLDEAMAAVVSGTLAPPVAGTVYCSLIEACEEIFEMRRAQEWTDALSRWCDRQEGMVTFTGQCLPTAPRCCGCGASSTPPPWPQGRHRTASRGLLMSSSTVGLSISWARSSGSGAGSPTPRTPTGGRVSGDGILIPGWRSCGSPRGGCRRRSRPSADARPTDPGRPSASACSPPSSRSWSRSAI